MNLLARALIGAVAGGLVGFGYGQHVAATNVTAMRNAPWSGVVFGMMMGALLACGV